MAEKQGILVIAEVTPDGTPDKVTLELLGLGAKLAASSGKQLQAAWWPAKRRAWPRHSSPPEPNTVFAVDGDAFAAYDPDLHVAALVEDNRETACALGGAAGPHHHRDGPGARAWPSRSKPG